MSLLDFYQNTTKKFGVAVIYNDTVPDITNDTVTFYLKDNKIDSNYILSASGEVITQGWNGVANFTLTDEQTDLNPEIYYYEIIWDTLAGDRYVLESDSVRIIPRI